MNATTPDAAYLQPLENAFARELDPDEAIVYNALADIRYYTGNFLTQEERGAIASCKSWSDEILAERALSLAIAQGDAERVEHYTSLLVEMRA